LANDFTIWQASITATSGDLPFLGVVTYYAGSFVAGIFLVILDLLMGWNWVGNEHDLVIGLISLPFGLLACWGVYKYLEITWQKATTKTLKVDNQVIQEFGTPEMDENTEKI
jgi:hypothetical protein